MKFGTGSNAERTQKYGGSKYKMTYIRPNIYINKQTSPIFDCVTPVSVSLAMLARQSHSRITKLVRTGHQTLQIFFGGGAERTRLLLGLCWCDTGFS